MKKAIKAGIAEAERSLTESEARAVASHVDLSLDLFTVGDSLTEREVKLVREFARHTARDPLLSKALIAIFMEQGLTEFPVVDGPVGRALDEAIAVLRPLIRGRTFWNSF